MKTHDMNVAKILQFPKVYSSTLTIEEGTIVSCKTKDGKIKLGLRLDDGRFLTEYYSLRDD